MPFKNAAWNTQALEIIYYPLYTPPPPPSLSLVIIKTLFLLTDREREREREWRGSSIGYYAVEEEVYHPSLTNAGTVSMVSDTNHANCGS